MSRPIIAMFVFLIASPILAEADVGGIPRELKPSARFSIRFPNMPPTFSKMRGREDVEPTMFVHLPRNYSAQRKHPLLVYMGGGGGGHGDKSLDRAVELCEEQDFVCVNLPLFVTTIRDDQLIRDEDARLAWPLYKRMLDKLDRIVPNIDPNHRAIGGFSNGGNMTRYLIGQTHGDAVRRFSAFYILETRPPTEFDFLKGVPLLLVVGSKSQGTWEGLPQYRRDAVAAGVKLTFHEMDGVGHAVPRKEIPTITAWLRKTLLTTKKSSSKTPNPKKKH